MDLVGVGVLGGDAGSIRRGSCCILTARVSCAGD